MLSITHAAIAVAAASLTFQLGTDNSLALGLALLGSQLPDLDTTTSTIGQICFPLSNWLEDNFPHRTITHSLLATVVISAIAWTQKNVRSGSHGEKTSIRSDWSH